LGSCLLGDGSLLINKKGVDGLPKPTANANFAITLKNKEYTYHLWQNIYFTICSKTVPTPWPNPKTGGSVGRSSLLLNIILNLEHYLH
jgi:hypothetical protein